MQRAHECDVRRPEADKRGAKQGANLEIKRALSLRARNPRELGLPPGVVERRKIDKGEMACALGGEWGGCRTTGALDPATWDIPMALTQRDQS